MRSTRALYSAPLVSSESASARRLQSFATSLDKIWRTELRFGQRPTRLGLAISGGVDSMALASLCRRLNDTRTTKDELVAFTVDHGLRPGSTQEAQDVQHALRSRLGIRSEVLKVTGWDHTQDKSRNETQARQKRYRLLGQACAAAGVDTLLLAHHGDDQPATVLLRIVHDQLGAGLRGMAPAGQIPDCEGMYGVHMSGVPVELADDHALSTTDTKIDVESGGVALLRPLLGFTKAELIAECEENKIDWVEDETNADIHYATRNTINHLLSDGSLPEALRRPRMLKMTSNLLTSRHRLTAEISGYMKRMAIRLNPATGQLQVFVPLKLVEKLTSDSGSFLTRSHIAQTLVSMVMPKANVQRQHVEAFAKRFCIVQTAYLDSCRAVLIDCRGVADDSLVYVFERSNPDRVTNEALSARLNMSLSETVDRGCQWTPWFLWDERFWVRMGSTRPFESDSLSFGIRFVRESDVKRVKPELQRYYLRAMRSSLLGNRLTLPVLTIPDPLRPTEDLVVALPTLGWSDPSIVQIAKEYTPGITPWLCEVRYKSVKNPYIEMTTSH